MIFFSTWKRKYNKKNKERYLFMLAGMGLINLNTHYDVFFKKDTLPSGIIRPEKRYKGTVIRFSPRVSLGYQLEKIKASIDAYITEGSDLSNLTALWLGSTISYEIPLGRKNKTSSKK